MHHANNSCSPSFRALKRPLGASVDTLMEGAAAYRAHAWPKYVRLVGCHHRAGGIAERSSIKRDLLRSPRGEDHQRVRSAGQCQMALARMSQPGRKPQRLRGFSAVQTDLSSPERGRRPSLLAP